MYNVKVEPIPNNLDYRSRLIVEIDDKQVAEYWDGGEPEDRYFGRDWSWIQGELERAYQTGLNDGAYNATRFT